MTSGRVHGLGWILPAVLGIGFAAHAALPVPKATPVPLPAPSAKPAAYYRLIPPVETGSRIAELKIDQQSLRTFTRFVGSDAGNLMTWVEFEGKWAPAKGNLLIQAEGPDVTGNPPPAAAEVKNSGKFRVSMPVPSETTHLKFIAIGIKGEIRMEAWSLQLEQTQVAAQDPEFSSANRRYFFSPGIGYSSISYEQTGIAPISESALTAKFSAIYLLDPPRWDVGGSLFLTALPLSSTGENVRFVGVNLRAGYAIPSVSEPWKLTIAGGLYYATMIVPGNAFGFQNMSGPQLYPVLRRAFMNQSAVTFYAKFSPVAAGFGIGNPSLNREIAFGGQYTLPGSWIFGDSNADPNSKGHRKTVSLTWDYAMLKVTVSPLAADTRSFTLGASIGL